MAFRGRFEHSLDSKDRLTIPARFRASLADGVVLSAGLDPCVELYGTEGFEQYSERYLADLNPLGSDARRMRRRIHGRSFDESLDSAGRVRLPRFHIEHARLEGGCVVIGVSDHLEIWNPGVWAEEEAEIDATANEMAEGLAGEKPERP